MMEIAFDSQYIIAILVIGLLLIGLYATIKG